MPKPSSGKNSSDTTKLIADQIRSLIPFPRILARK